MTGSLRGSNGWSSIECLTLRRRNRPFREFKHIIKSFFEVFLGFLLDGFFREIAHYQLTELLFIEDFLLAAWSFLKEVHTILVLLIIDFFLVFDATYAT